jgi:hypothetical protein
MLDGHPQIVWQRGWEVVAEAIEHMEMANRGGCFVALEHFGQLSTASPDELRNWINQGIGRLLVDQGKDVFGATVHTGFKWLPSLWESARFIHLIRDPRDVAISYKKLGWAGHHYFATDEWSKSERDWDAMSASLSKDQAIDVRYEELVCNPKQEMKRVCEFLGVEYSDAVFDYVDTSNYSYPRKDLAYRWRDQLSDDQLKLVESKIMCLMTERGYEPVTTKQKYSALRIGGFRLLDSWNRRLSQINELGLYYVVADKIARKLDWKFMMDRLEKARAAKREKHVSTLEKNY